jgi:hypothetical protein
MNGVIMQFPQLRIPEASIVAGVRQMTTFLCECVIGQPVSHTVERLQSHLFGIVRLDYHNNDVELRTEQGCRDAFVRFYE